MDDSAFNRFLTLTDEALAEKDLDRFIELLLERDRVAAALVSGEPPLTEEGAVVLLEKESFVSCKLETQRQELLKEMEQLVSSMKAVRKYTPRFPFPFMPAFFDRAG
jgi:hypothetical protein